MLLMTERRRPISCHDRKKQSVLNTVRVPKPTQSRSSAQGSGFTGSAREARLVVKLPR